MSRLSSRRPDDDMDDTADEIDLTDADIPISSAAEEEGDEEEEEEDFKPQAKKKKPKKVAPIGRNGLKKRRVMKSRTTTDTKGYMRTCIHS
jgi:DNA polymerase delta subunit 3